jgi:hypothetical protein
MNLCDHLAMEVKSGEVRRLRDFDPDREHGKAIWLKGKAGRCLSDL